MKRLDLMRGAAAVATLIVALLLVSAPGAGAAQDGSFLRQIGYSARATSLVTAPDGKLWFGGFRAGWAPTFSLVGWLDAGGALAEYPVTEAGYEKGARLAVGVDGTVWFTDVAGNSVGRVSPDGAVTKFPLPTPDAVPTAITAGPGGEMWFVEEAAGKVGRVSPAGQITEYALRPDSLPRGIAEGPDGALWVTESGTARIARLSSQSGAATHFELPDPDSAPGAIVSGPGGRLWFSNESSPEIGRITPGGEIEMLPVSSDFGTRELVVGGDGNLWFTTGNAIGSISPEGGLGEPSCVTSSCVYPVLSLAKGPDGGIWFGAASRQITSGGGGGAIGTVFEPGVIGRFDPPSLKVRLGKRATRVNDGLTTIPISCHGGIAGEACRGWLRLTTTLGGRKVRLDQHRYRLEPTTGRRLPLRLGGRGMRQLARSKRIVVRISVTLAGGGGAGKRFVLQARRHR